MYRIARFRLCARKCAGCAASFYAILYEKSDLPLQGGCITKLERFLAAHLLVIGAVGIGVACLQVRPPALLCRLAQERDVYNKYIAEQKITTHTGDRWV